MENIYDIAIIGGGPAGMTAAIYALRNGKKTVIIEKAVFGGQIVNSPSVENIPGFARISGDEFGDLMMEQVSKQGGELVFDEVLSLENDGEIAVLKLDLGEDIRAKAVIIASGTTHRRLNLDHEEELIGKGIHFCAVCDGNFYKGKDVVMVGGGNSAFVETSYLLNVARKVIMLQDLPVFTAEAKLQQQLADKENLEQHCDTRVLEYLLKDGKLCGLRYQEKGLEKTVECDAVFLAVGLLPDNERFRNYAVLDERGYFLADEYGKTRTKNVFVAGDCRSKSLRQVATACSDGANAAIEACRYLG